MKALSVGRCSEKQGPGRVSWCFFIVWVSLGQQEEEVPSSFLTELNLHLFQNKHSVMEMKCS